MASKDNKIEIDLAVQLKELQDLQKAITDMKNAGTLVNTNGNTIKGILNKINGLIQEVGTSLKEGIGPVGLKKISDGFNDISKSLGRVRIGEEAAGKTATQHSKDLEKAQQAYDDLNKKAKEYAKILKDNENQIKKTGVNIDGTYSEKNASKVMVGARKLFRGDRKGRDTRVESILATGDKNEIEKLKSTENKSAKQITEDTKVAAEAEELMNKFVQQALEGFRKTEGSLKEIIDDLNQAKNILDEQKSTSFFNEEQTNSLKTYSDSLKNTSQSLGAVANKANETGASIQQVSEKTEQSNNTFNKAAKQLISYSIVYRTFKSMMKQAVQTIIQMDGALTDLTVVTGKTRDQVQKYVPALRELALATSSTMTDVANLTSAYVRQGRTIADSLILAEQTAKAAKIAGISVSDSVQYMTSAINGFNLAASDSEHVSDVFAKLATESATDYENLAIALSKVSAQANTAGMSIEYTTALLAKGIETTQEAPESIGTALKTIIARMREIGDYSDSLDQSSSINSVESALKSADVELRDTNGQFRDLEEVFNELGPKWDTLNKMQQQSIAQAVAGTRQQSRFLAIMQDWDRTLELTATATDAAGASAYQYNQVSKGITAALTNLTTAWQSLIQNLVDNDILIGAVNMLKGVLEWIGDMLEKINSLGDGGNIAALLAMVAVGVKAVKEVYDKLTAGARERLELQKQELEMLQQINQKNAEAKTAEELAIEQAKEQNDLLVERGSILERIQAKAKSLNDTLNEKHEVKDNKEKELQEIRAAKNASELTKEQKKKYKEQKKADKDEEKALNKKSKILDKTTKKVEKGKKLSDKQTKLVKEQAKSEASKLRLKDKEVANDMTLTEEALNKNKAQKEQLNLDLALARTNEEKAKVEQDMQANDIEHAQLSADYEAKRQEHRELTTKAAEQEQIADTGNLTTEQASTMAAEQKENATKKTEENNKKYGTGLIKNLGIEIKSAMVNIAKSMASIATAALAAAALAFLAGAVGGAIGSIGTAMGDNSKAVTENQDTIYENKQKSTNLKNLRDEYQELLIKQQAGTITSEESDRMDDVINEIKEVDDTINGTGQDLINNIDNKIKDIDAENEQLIEQNYEMVKNNTGGLTPDQIQLAASQMAEVELKRSFDKNGTNAGLDKEIQQTALNEQESIMAGFDYEEYNKVLENNSWWDKLTGSDDAKAAEEWGRKLDELKEVSNEMSIEMAEARAATGDSLQKQVAAYKKQMEDPNLSQDTKDAIKKAYGAVDAISGTSDDVLHTLENSLGSSGVLELSASLTALGNNASSVATILDMLAESVDDFGNLTAESYGKMLEWDEDDWKKALGEEQYNALDEAGQLEAMKTKTLDKVQETIAGRDVTATLDDVTKAKNAQSDASDIIQSLMDGDELTNDQIATLQANNSDLMADTNFNEMLKNDKQGAAALLQKTLESNAEAQIVKFKTGQDTLISQIEQAQKDGNTSLVRDLQSQYNGYQMAIDSLAIKYTKLDKAANDMAMTNAEISAIQKEIDSGVGDTIGKYEELKSTQADLLKQQQASLDTTWENLKNVYGLTGGIEDYYNIVDGQLIPDEEKLKTLSDQQVGIILDQLEGLQEKQDLVNETNEMIEEANQAQLDATIEMQDQAIAAMKARMDAEYEATQQSLEKRQELYEKYFDSLDQEEDTEDYENDRQALLNRIAKLSTATDSASLAALKEAQSELSDLDDEYNDSQRDLRREAVSNSFDAQNEALDKAYEDASADNQKLWEEFMAMGTDAQTQLFQQYGDSFQEVTDLQRQVAQDELDSYLSSIASLRGSSMTVNGKTYSADGTITSNAVTDTGSGSNIVATPTQVSGSADNSTTNNTATDNRNIVVNISGVEANNMNSIEDTFRKILAEDGTSTNIKP